MSRILIRPAYEQRARLFTAGMTLVGALAVFVTIFQLGAWYQRKNVAIGTYCHSDMSACWYEVDFTNR